MKQKAKTTKKVKTKKATPKRKAKQPGQVTKAFKFATPAEMQAKIDDYFKKPPTRKATIGQTSFDVPCITIMGLVLHLGFKDKGDFYNQAKRTGFEPVVATARSRVEHEYEKLLQGQNVTGAIFALKNFGWKDQPHPVPVQPDGGGGQKPTLTIPLDMDSAEATKLYLSHLRGK